LWRPLPGGCSSRQAARRSGVRPQSAATAQRPTRSAFMATPKTSTRLRPPALAR